MNKFSIKANLVDCFSRSIQSAEITVENGKIHSISFFPSDGFYSSLPYISPGFIDAHVHIESSMLIPSEFARLAVVHGTVSTVSDPHEIANVCGIEGVRFMINNGKTVPFKFNFGAPSCVPATVFETAGSEINADDVAALLAEADIKYLSEMMNFPGAIYGDPEVLNKINAAQALGKPVDGHAPGLRGLDLETYINRGISTDHECFTIEEAKEKLSLGMKIIVREGSAAKNFDALIPLIVDHHEMMMFCSDDKHPDNLVMGHINKLCAKAVSLGYDVFNVLQVACINPIIHYKLDVGMLRVGDPADFILLEDLTNFNVMATFIDGKKVAVNGVSLIERINGEDKIINSFDIHKIKLEDLHFSSSDTYDFPVIKCLDGQLITPKLSLKPLKINNTWASNVAQDILKIVVVNRYHKAPIAMGFIHRFGMKKGAIASSVAHDSHNIVAVGVDDESLLSAINLIIDGKGGVSCVGKNNSSVLALPIGGLMSADDGYEIAEKYTAIDFAAKQLGSTLSSPFMSLSFMALLVIPHVKLSDKGLFDGDSFKLYEH
jgi:adenine deaminase